ncbi:MAG: nucleoside phosphorylase [Lewinellaceae bacterium]|nr:nucleoside phosphorylase [Lewinellaceae bacterium]
MKLASSELILNPDGSIYHLNLHPEQVAPIIITVGDPDRVSRVSRYFDKVEHRVQKREFVTHTGWLDNMRLSVVSTGIGADNVDIVMNELDALVNIDLDTRQVRNPTRQLTFVRIGTSGGIQPGMGTDAFLVSEAAFGLDGLLRFYDFPELWENEWVGAFHKAMDASGGWPSLPYFAHADQGLVQACTGDFVRGITATNPGFYGPQGRQLRAHISRPGLIDALQQFEFQGKRITNLEMETAAIYGLAQLLGHRAISFNAILANRANGTFSADPHKTEQRLIEQVLENILAFN